MLRVDGGVARPHAQGSLDLVDRFAWAGAHTLRWRSRAPQDPPFRATEITYVLEYTLSGVLVDEGGGSYRLSPSPTGLARSGPCGPGWRSSGALSLAAAWVIRHGRARGLFDPPPDVSGLGDQEVRAARGIDAVQALQTVMRPSGFVW